MRKFEITYHLVGNITVERIVEAETFKKAKEYIQVNTYHSFSDDNKVYYEFDGRNIVLATIQELKA
ncbi:hypothetical protein [Heyndrickxia sporothermodurans]|uniref:hypothetical protein n=1 Tax=Heyndrickxia sporothermodurans TaxID=46224 RepID=UPI002E1F09B2|nr:hypothetical protein [Heyndrickxia sporothermodurans]MED3698617.1 hypothetical protein [Heyndrickxia sporothermodurans]